MVPPLPVCGVGRVFPQPVQVGSAADDEHPLRRHPAPLPGDPAVRLVGGDDAVRRPERAPFEEQQHPVQPVGPAVVLGQVHLRRQVVVVEHEADTEQLVEPGQQEIRLRRIAGVDDLEPPPREQAQADPERAQPAVQELEREQDRAAGGLKRAIAADPDALQLEAGLPVLAPPLGADHRHLGPQPAQGGRLQPDPPVEGHRQVLDDDQDSLTL